MLRKNHYFKGKEGTMKWRQISLRSRRKEKELKMYVEMKIMEARIQRLLDTLERKEKNAA